MRFSEWFKGSGWTQAEFARKIGAPRQTVQSWLTGQRVPTLYYALAVEVLSDGAVAPVEWLSTQQHLALRGMRS